MVGFQVVIEQEMVKKVVIEVVFEVVEKVVNEQWERGVKEVYDMLIVNLVVQSVLVFLFVS